MRPCIRSTTSRIKRSAAVLPGAVCKMRDSSSDAVPKRKEADALLSSSDVASNNHSWDVASNNHSPTVTEENRKLKMIISAFVNPAKIISMAVVVFVVSHQINQSAGDWH